MSEATRDARTQHRMPSWMRRPASKYKQKLQQKSSAQSQLDLMENPSESSPASTAHGAQPGIETLEALIHSVPCEGTAFQSVAVAAVQALERALCYERQAADAAISLGQQEKMRAMVKTAERAVAMLRGTIGARVQHMCSDQGEALPDSPSWWFALNDAREVLEEGTDRMTSLTTAQPDGSPARALSECIAHLLRTHHDTLLIEAEEWIA